MNEEQIYNQRLRSVKRFIPFLENTIEQLKNPRMKSREQHLLKMESLYTMIMDKKKKLRVETLAKCEDVMVKLYHKVKGTDCPLPPLPKLELNEDLTNKRKSVDLYSLAGESLKPENSTPTSSNINTKQPKSFFLSPPISAADLEGLENDNVDVTTSLNEKLSLNELNDLRTQLVRKLSETCINTTVRTKPVLAKLNPTPENKSKIVHHSKKIETVKSSTPKVLRDSGDIFQNAFSEIDKSYKIEAKKRDERRHSNNKSTSETSSSDSRKKDEEKTKKDDSVKEKKREDHDGKRKEEGEKHKSSGDKKKTDDRKKDETSSCDSSENKDVTHKKKSESDVDRKKEKSKDRDRKDKERHRDKERHKNRHKEDKSTVKQVSVDQSKHDDDKKSVDVEKHSSNEKNIDASSRPANRDPRLKRDENERLAYKYNPKPKKPTVPENIDKKDKDLCQSHMEKLAAPPSPPVDLFSPESPDEIDKAPLPPVLNNMLLLNSTKTNDVMTKLTPDANLNKVPQFRMDLALNFIPPPAANTGATTPIYDGMCTTPRYEEPYNNFNVNANAVQQRPHGLLGDFPRNNMMNHHQYNQNFPRYSGNNMMGMMAANSFCNTGATPNNYMEPPRMGGNDYFNMNRDNRMNFNRGNMYHANQYPGNATPYRENRMTYKEYKEQKEKEYREKFLDRQSRKVEENDPRRSTRELITVKEREKQDSSRSKTKETFARDKDPRRSKDEEEITSPLESLYTSSKAKTGKGYGVQFKIPKKNKEIPKKIVEKKEIEDDDDDDVIEVRKEIPTIDLLKCSEKENHADDLKTEPDSIKVETEKPTKINEDDTTIKSKEDSTLPTKKDEEESILGKFFQNLMKSSNKDEKKGALLSLISTFSDSFSDNQLEKITEIIRSNDDKNVASDPKTDQKEESKIETKPETIEAETKIETSERPTASVETGSKIVRHKTELDRLHEDIREMFIRDGVVTATGKRMCRILKGTTTEDNVETATSGGGTSTNTNVTAKLEEKKKISPRKTTKRLKLNENLEIRELSVVLPKMSLEEIESERKYSLRSLNKSNGEKKDKDATVENEEKKTIATVAVKKKTSKADDKSFEDEIEDIPKLDVDLKTLHDKDYYLTSRDSALKCKLCDSMKSSASHYKRHHPGVEILSSRISNDIAKIAIQDAIKNEQYQNVVNVPKPTNERKYFCIFCNYKTNGNTTFFNSHLISHTGEYIYKCPKCTVIKTELSQIRRHMMKSHKTNNGLPNFTIPKISNNGVEIYGYICERCNYIQMDRGRLKSHIELYHGNDEQINIHKITLNKYNLDELIEKKATKKEVKEEDDNEMETDAEYNDKPPVLTPQVPTNVASSRKQNVSEPSVFTCNTDVLEENKKIEEDRIKTLQQLNIRLRPRTSLGMADRLSNILKSKENEDVVPATTESSSITDDEKKTELQVYEKTNLQKNEKLPVAVVAVGSNVVENTPKTNQNIENVIDKLRGMLNDGSSSTTGEESTPSPSEPPKLQNSETSSKAPPPLTYLDIKKDSLLELNCEVLNLGPLKVIKSATTPFFSCCIPPCVFSTRDEQYFVKHCKNDHEWNVNWQQFDKCQLCRYEFAFDETKPLLYSAYLHLKNEHASFLDGYEKTIKKECVDDELTPPVISIPSPVIDDENTFDFSFDDKKEDENPFSFKIVDVVSLANVVDENEDAPRKNADDAVTNEKIPNVPNTTKVGDNVGTTKVTNTSSEWTKNSQRIQISIRNGKKSENAMKKFLNVYGDLYKCPEYACLFTTNKRKMFDIHVTMHPRFKEKKSPCVYCEKDFILETIGGHYEQTHRNCGFACVYCFYRCSIKEYMDIHLLLAHSDQVKTMNIIKIDRDDIVVSAANVKEKLIENNPENYKCCDKSYFYLDDFIVHVELCGKFVCAHENCGSLCKNSDDLRKHWGEMHNVFPFKCCYCPFGSFNLNMMMVHSAVEHPNLPPDIIDRSKYQLNKQSKKLPKAVCDFKRLLSELNPPSALTPIVPAPVALKTLKLSNGGMLYCLTTTPSTKPTVATVTTVKPSHVVMLDANKQPIRLLTTTTASAPLPALRPILQKPVQQPPPIVTPPQQPTPTKIEENKEDSDLDEPMMVIDENFDGADDKAVDPLSLEAEKSVGENEETRNKIGLVGSQLYRCAMCLAAFPESGHFKRHIVSCKFPNTVKPFKCHHCCKFFKHQSYLIDHLSYHGPERFSCSLCNRKFSHASQVKNHLKNQHNIVNVVLQPISNTKPDIHTDFFVGKPQIVKPTNENDTTSVTVTTSTTPTTQTTTQPSEVKTVFYSHETEDIPHKSILSYDITCGHCKKFKNKVRSNIVRHLLLHKNDAEFVVPDTAPVNPVPCLEKNEKMFDKMYNLASSSHVGGRMGGTKADSKKAINEDNYPKFVPLNRRFRCCSVGCNYLCLEEGNLRHHLTALHDEELTFVCVHCRIDLSNAPDVDAILKHLKLHALHLYKCEYCEYVHNLRHKIERHLHEEHPNDVANVVVIRAMDSEPLDETHTTTSSSSSTTTSTVPPPAVPQKRWRCLMCKYRTFTETEALNHIKNKHSIDCRYKCALCAFKSNSIDRFNGHFEAEHPENDVDVILSYSEIGEINETTTPVETDQFDTTPLWLRDKPRVKHIRGILFDENTSLSDNVPGNTSPVKKKVTRISSGGENDSSPPMKKRKRSVENVLQSKQNYEVKKEEIVTIRKSKSEDEIILIDDDEAALAVDALKESKAAVAEPKEFDDIDLLCRYGDTGMPLNRQFKCPKCEKYRTTKMKDFVQHVAEEMNYHKFLCNVCTAKFSTLDLSREHCKLNHDSSMVSIKQLPCNDAIKRWLHILLTKQCEIMRNLGFSTDDIPENIEIFLTQDSPPIDRGTKRTVATTVDLNVDKKIKIEECTTNLIAKDRYVCSICEMIFDSVPEIEFHGKERHGILVPYEVKVTKLRTTCEYTSRTSYRCRLCDTLGFKSALEQHFTIEHPNQPMEFYRFRCGLCDKKFENVKDVHAHLKEYGKVNNKFYLNVNNKKIMIGTTIHIYKCPICDHTNRSANSANMRSHLRVHTKPIQCNLCMATFTKRSDGHSHHSRQHPHNPESLSERREMVEKINELMREVNLTRVTVVEDDENPDEEVSVKIDDDKTKAMRNVAKKSTCSLAKPDETKNYFSFYGLKEDRCDLGKILIKTTIDYKEAVMTCEQFGSICDVNPSLIIEDCMAKSISSP